jgi:hypothetical protein
MQHLRTPRSQGCPGDAALVGASSLVGTGPPATLLVPFCATRPPLGILRAVKSLAMAVKSLAGFRPYPAASHKRTSGRAMGTDDTVQIRCSRCKSKFRDKARRVRSGYSRQCPDCECMVFFEDGSPNKDIHAALRESERVRKALREEEFEKIASRAAAADETDGADTGRAISRRQIGRRSHSPGRS